MFNRIGNNDAIIMNDLDVKTKIIDYLFNSIDLSKYRYTMLDSLDRLNNLKKNDHYVSPNFKGFNYFVIFKKINDTNYCILVDKKKLSYHRNKVNVYKTPIFKIKISTSDSIYQGTIMDCKMVRKENKYFMLIKDCYIMTGNNILNMEMQYKMKYIDGIISNQFPKNYCKNFIFKINKLYNYDDLQHLVDNVIPNCDIEIQGLIFYPKYSGITVIHIEKKVEKIEIDNTVKQVDNNSYHLIKNIVEFLSKRNYSYEKGKHEKLYISKTNITDVYNLYKKDSDSYTRIGIAHVPNMKISLYLQKNIDDNKKEIYCVFNKKFNKYIPLSLV
jgi:hypothetical protein